MATSTAAIPESDRQRESPFLALPLELVLEIISHLSDDRSTLCALAQTCRLIQPFCEDHIYASIELLSTRDLQAIRYAFTRRRRRVESVQSLKILYKYHKDLADTEDDRTAFNNYVKEMKALRTWHIESPFDNFKWESKGGNEWVQQDMASFREALETASLRKEQLNAREVGLAKLEKLIIHSHGTNSDFWELGRFHCLFRHPALRYLHISCVSLPPDLPELEDYKRTTPLTTLIFDECELEPGSLRRILATPKALRNLTLGENVANVRHSRGPAPKLTSSPEAAVQALEPLAHSLETLTHLDPTHLTLADSEFPSAMKLSGNGLRNFHHLRKLTCDRCSFLHQGVIRSPPLAPPNLEILQLHRYNSSFGPGDDWFERLPEVSPYTRLPSLKSLELIQPIVVDRIHAPAEHSDYMCQPERLLERHAYAYQLWKSQVNVKFFAEARAKRSYIPPYLHGEPLPELLCVYDAADLGFHRVLSDEPDLLDLARAEGTLDCHPVRENGSPPTGPKPMAHGLTRPEPVETDQLNHWEISGLNNQVYRAIADYRRRLPKPCRDSDDDFDISSGDSDVDLSDTELALFLDEVEEEYDPEDLLDMQIDEMDEDAFVPHAFQPEGFPPLTFLELMALHNESTLMDSDEEDRESPTDQDEIDAFLAQGEVDDYGGDDDYDDLD